MISAFGVDHGISKSMKGRQLKALIATKNRGSGRAQEYARNKLALHRTGKNQATHPLGQIGIADKKSRIQAVTRTTDATRRNNRNGIF